MKPGRRILVIRNDKLGDVILATPVIVSLAQSFPEAEIWALVRPACREVVADNPRLAGVLLDTGGRDGFLDLLDKVRRLNFDTALILFSDFRMGLLCSLSGIPQRIGPASKIAQILYTRRITQHRSRSLRHEADYNLELAEAVGTKPVRRLEVVTGQAAKSEVENFFARLPRDTKKPLIGVHPTSGGSDRNWRPERYGELIRSLIHDQSCEVFLTCGPGDAEIIKRVTLGLEGGYYTYPGAYGIQVLAEILRRVDVFVSANTGPMHLAAAMGTPTVSLFSPLWVTRPERWGPLGNPQAVLKPQLPPCPKCRPQECGHPHCVELVSVGQVVEAVRGRL